MRLPLIAMGLLAAVLCFAWPLHADRRHDVSTGETLSVIARRYAVNLESLAAANRIEPDDVIHPGQSLLVPQRGEVFVAQGQTLDGIARAHGTTALTLAQHNRMTVDAPLQIGQRLLLPGMDARSSSTPRHAPPRRSRDRSIEAVLVRPSTGQRVSVRLLDEQGRLRPAVIATVDSLMDRTGVRRSLRPDRRLVQALAKVANQFSGRTIFIVSGYRPARGFTRESSRHTRGQALDLHVSGVSNTTLRDYCRHLGRVGVGYYPRSTFVHLDVRDRPAYWVDWSGPGERPVYRSPAAGPTGPVEPPDEGGDHAQEETDTLEDTPSSEAPADVTPPPAQSGDASTQGATNDASAAQR